ncbi:hypothetical protein [Algivirga pacifica]|uniref:CHASE2 domain-containing protein n=1 Tax=Algivirga pacifica TaxID=1162670 RepID=A0ABP9DE22_9BACT
MKKLIHKLQEKKWLLWGITSFHAVFLIVAVLFYNRLPFALGDEVTLIEMTSIMKNTLFKVEEKPPKERFLFINCAWEKDLIPKLDEYGWEIGKIDITDRNSLGKFVQKINRTNAHELLLMDIQFYMPTANDSVLAAELPKLKKGLVSYHKGADNKPRYPIFKGIPLGLSDMESQLRSNQDDLVLKYHLIQGDSLKTTPLRMYEEIHQDTLEHGLFFNSLGGYPILNAYIIEHPIRKNDLFNKVDSLRYPYMHLSEVINISDKRFAKIVKDKVIVLGDFENLDIHRTIYGKQPGPLILVNAFLALENGDNRITYAFLLFMFIGFAFASYKAIVYKDPVTTFLERKLSTDHFLLELTRDTLFYLVFFGIMSLVSYFFFNMHLTILVLSFYLNGLEQLMIFLHGEEDENQEDKQEREGQIQSEIPVEVETVDRKDV